MITTRHGRAPLKTSFVPAQVFFLLWPCWPSRPGRSAVISIGIMARRGRRRRPPTANRGARSRCSRFVTATIAGLWSLGACPTAAGLRAESKKALVKVIKTIEDLIRAEQKQQTDDEKVYEAKKCWCKDAVETLTTSTLTTSAFSRRPTSKA